MSLDIALRDPTATYETEELYSKNITHNLTEMADKAGIYYALWRPEEIGKSKAKDIIEILKEGLRKLKEKPEYFKQFDSPNKWGVYSNLVNFVEDYIHACECYPEAVIEISR